MMRSVPTHRITGAAGLFSGDTEARMALSLCGSKRQLDVLKYVEAGKGWKNAVIRTSQKLFHNYSE